MTESKKFRRVGVQTEITPSPKFKSLEKLPIELQKYQLQQFIPTTELGRLAQTSKQNLSLTEKELKERPNRQFEALREMNNILRVLEYQKLHPIGFAFNTNRQDSAILLTDKYLKLLYQYNFEQHDILLQQILSTSFSNVLHSAVFEAKSNLQDWKTVIDHISTNTTKILFGSKYVSHLVYVIHESSIDMKTKSNFIYNNFEPLAKFMIWNNAKDMWIPLLEMTSNWTNQMRSKYNDLLSSMVEKYQDFSDNQTTYWKINYIGFPLQD